VIRRWWVRRCVRDEAGTAILEWMIGIGLLLMPTMGLVSMSSWLERQNMARAGDPAAGMAEGDRLVAEIAENHGVDAATVSVAYTGSTDRGGTVVATVSVVMPALTFPGLGAVGSVTWSTSHSERVDQYRGFG
jgi:hypothetical protein